MGRPEEPLDPDSPLFEFAQGLRALRRDAGSPTYRQLVPRASFSQSVLSAAASGRTLPTLPVLRAYVKACGGDVEQWSERWWQVHALLTATNPGLLDDGDPHPEAAASEPLERPDAAEATAHQRGGAPALDRTATVAFAPLAKGDPSRIGPFRPLARLGGGAMGEVFLAAGPGGRPVAVKRVRPEYARDPVFRARFAKEVAASRKVSGGHSPALIDADTGAERPWIATAYVPGPSLQQVVGLSGGLPDAVVLALGAGIAKALVAIHVEGIVHRDLKPSNILVDRDGPKVIDFGICRALDGTALTATGVRVGTAGFTAPELAARGEAVPAGDVFALGCVLAYAATGITPFSEGPDVQVLYRIVHEPPDPEALACGDETLRSLIEACLAKDPDARPTPQAVIESCGGALAPGESWLPADLAAQAAEYGSQATRQLARASRRRLVRRAQIGLASLLLVTAVVAITVFTASTSPGTGLHALGPRQTAGADTGAGSGTGIGSGTGAGAGVRATSSVSATPTTTTTNSGGASAGSTGSSAGHGQVQSAPAAARALVRAAPPAATLGIWTSAEDNGSFSTVAGQRPNVANTYLYWGVGFPASFAGQAQSAGATPFVEIEPWQGGGPDDCSFASDFPAMTTIGANGSAISTYLHAFGSAIASFGHPVIVTFAHEFNVSGQYPWAQGDCEGTTPAQWITAWDAVKNDIDATAGGRAYFMWAPGANADGTTADPTPYWPGAPQVDMVGVGGYPSTEWGSRFGTFSGLFGPLFSEIHTRTSLPIFIAETNLAPLDGSGYQSLSGFVSDACRDGGDGVLQLQERQPLSGTQWSELDNALASDCAG